MVKSGTTNPKNQSKRKNPVQNSPNKLKNNTPLNFLNGKQVRKSTANILKAVIITETVEISSCVS